MRKLKKYKPTKFREKTSVYDKDAADYGFVLLFIMIQNSLSNKTDTYSNNCVVR